jgi:hypothetical protein
LFDLQYECEDILSDARLFDSLGVGLGTTEMINVALAVKKLGEDPHKGVETVSATAAKGLHTALHVRWCVRSPAGTVNSTVTAMLWQPYYW